MNNVVDNAPQQTQSGHSPKRPRSSRLQRIDEYRQEALAQPDALRANLGALNSDLMRMAYRLNRATNRALAHTSDLLQEFNTVGPAVAACLQVARQVDRLAQLELRLQGPPPPRETTPASGSEAFQN